jgi:hypothetical protein
VFCTTYLYIVSLLYLLSHSSRVFRTYHSLLFQCHGILSSMRCREPSLCESGTERGSGLKEARRRRDPRLIRMYSDGDEGGARYKSRRKATGGTEVDSGHGHK